jgi:hypothetical protein
VELVAGGGGTSSSALVPMPMSSAAALVKILMICGNMDSIVSATSVLTTLLEPSTSSPKGNP